MLPFEWSDRQDSPFGLRSSCPELCQSHGHCSFAGGFARAGDQDFLALFGASGICPLQIGIKCH